MTLRNAFASARRRRLRPERYTRIAGAFSAFLLIVVFVRQGANLYLASNVAAVAAAPEDALRFFRLVNAAWSLVFLGSASSLFAYRGIGAMLQSPRLAAMPVSGRRVRSAAAASSLTSVPVLLPVALAILAFVPSASTEPLFALLELAVLLLIGCFGFFLLMSVLRRLRTPEGYLELMEVAIMGAMIVANPDIMLVDHAPVVVLFDHVRVGPSAAGVFAAFPASGTVLGLLSAFLSHLFGASRSPAGKRRRLVFVLYRARIPVALLAATYAVELPLILTNPAVRSTVRNFVLFMLAVRVIWFLAFLFRAEQRIAEVVRAPAEHRAGILLYGPAAAVHSLLCGLPIVLYLGRLLLM